MRTLYTSFALAAIIACQQALALTLTQVDSTPSATPAEPPKIFAQTAQEEGEDLEEVEGSESASRHGGPHHHHCHCCEKCDCPHLQDCGIVVSDNNGAGAISTVGALATSVGTASTVNIPDVLVSEATATNTCGLELSSNQQCGNVTKTKNFCISGNICISETTTTTGCEGERECSDGRFTSTTQAY